MGKAEKLKEQRKIDKLRKELDRQKRRTFIGMIAMGVAAGLLVGTAVFFGTAAIKNQLFFGKQASKTTKSYKKGDRKYSKAPDMQIDTNKTYIAKFETNDGNFDVTMNAKDAPKTVNNFVVLARDKFYDGLTFHRIVKDFMIQGGDPEGTGGGGPGYKFDDEKIVGDYTVGTIAMANSGKNTNGSQFFIMTGDYSGGKLPKSYVIFGNVTSGMEIVNKINTVATKDNGQGEQSTPLDKVVINKVTVVEK